MKVSYESFKCNIYEKLIQHIYQNEQHLVAAALVVLEVVFILRLITRVEFRCSNEP